MRPCHGRPRDAQEHEQHEDRVFQVSELRRRTDCHHLVTLQKSHHCLAESYQPTPRAVRYFHTFAWALCQTPQHVLACTHHSSHHMMMMITFQRTVMLTCTTVQAQGVTSIAPGTSTCTYITILMTMMIAFRCVPEYSSSSTLPPLGHSAVRDFAQASNNMSCDRWSSSYYFKLCQPPHWLAQGWSRLLHQICMC